MLEVCIFILGYGYHPYKASYSKQAVARQKTSNIFCSQVKFQYMDNACFELYTYIIGGGDLQGPKRKAPPWLRKEDKDGKRYHCWRLLDNFGTIQLY